MKINVGCIVHVIPTNGEWRDPEAGIVIKTWNDRSGLVVERMRVMVFSVPVSAVLVFDCVEGSKSVSGAYYWCWPKNEENGG